MHDGQLHQFIILTIIVPTAHDSFTHIGSHIRRYRCKIIDGGFLFPLVLNPRRAGPDQGPDGLPRAVAALAFATSWMFATAMGGRTRTAGIGRCKCGGGYYVGEMLCYFAAAISASTAAGNPAGNGTPDAA